MGALEHRFSTAGLVVGVALCAASGCGGAKSTPRPASQRQRRTGDVFLDGSGDSGSSSGGGRDATMEDEPSPGDDMTADATPDSGDDVGSEPAEEAGPPDAGGCASVCTAGSRCCTVPGTLSYGQCYSVLCGYCCPAPL